MRVFRGDKPHPGLTGSSAGPLLIVHDLIVDYRSPHHPPTRAVDGISFEITPGQSIGILGESGSGKSTLALSILQVLPKNAAILGGRIEFDGCDLASTPEPRLRQMRGARMALVFQHPELALNPFMSVGRQVTEVIRAHHAWSWSRCRFEAKEVLARVFGGESERLYDAYPHELSGGLRQRASIAQAIACHPQLIIADEPTASLDAVTQAGILKLFEDLKSESGVSLILITHHPAILAGLVDRVLVLRMGKLVEQGNLRDVYQRPATPYTADLLRSAAAGR